LKDGQFFHPVSSLPGLSGQPIFISTGKLDRLHEAGR